MSVVGEQGSVCSVMAHTYMDHHFIPGAPAAATAAAEVPKLQVGDRLVICKVSVAVRLLWWLFTHAMHPFLAFLPLCC